MPIPTDPEALLRREQLAEALTEAGFPTTKATLATQAVRGGGPAFRKFGRHVVYQWGSSLTWAKGKLSVPVESTAELRVARRAAAPSN
jgi:hypothetical protein